MRCFKGCFGSKETKKLLQNQHQQPLLPCNEEEEEEIIKPVKEIAVLLSGIKSKEKISSPNERKPTIACVDDDENLMEKEKPEIKNKNREENDKEEDDNGGGSTLHSISNDINASSKDDPENLSQERISGDQKATSTDSTESLFSLSIDSRKQFWTITEEQQGDKEVNSPLKDITSRVESSDENHLHFAGQRVEVRIDGKKKKPSIRHEDDKENVKWNENRIKLTTKEKNSIDLRKLKPLSGTKENVIDTASFSSWLGGGGSSENASLKRSRSNNANNSPESEKNYDVKRSAKVERKEFKESNESLSVQSTPSCSVGDDGDERYSEGTIGRYLQTKKRFRTSSAFCSNVE